jgi:O-antigen ligase
MGHGVHSSYTAAGELSPHNVPLWLLVEVGLLGLGTYLVFLVSTGAVYLATAGSRRFTLEGKTAAVGLSLVAAVATADMFLMTPLSSGSGWYFMIFVGATLRACAGFPVARSPDTDS